MAYPDYICHWCFIDLEYGFTAPETAKELEARRTEEDKLMEQIFGKRDFRQSRKGSSVDNFLYWQKKKEARHAS